MGCNGGLPIYAYEYVKEHGQMLASDYPYTGRDSTCKYDKNKVKVAVSKYNKVQSSSPDQLKAALNQGPVSLVVDGSGIFRFYAGGILNQGCGNSPNLAVSAVGYGVENG